MSSKLAEANNHLALSLYHLLAKEDKNVFFSPLSISTAMCMLYCGAEGETAQELKHSLGYEEAGLGDEEVKSAFQKLMEELEGNPEGYTLNCANMMVATKGFAVRDKYKLLLQDSFKALLKEVDVQREGELAVKQINEWVGQKTEGMITQMLDYLDPETTLMLLNAVYFKGTWEDIFNENYTRQQHFYNNGKTKKNVDMMHKTEAYDFVQAEFYKALQLPYKGHNVAMLILLPDDTNGLDQLEPSLGASFVRDLKLKMQFNRVCLSLPRFRLEYSKSLVKPFQGLGVQRSFLPTAQFGPMGEGLYEHEYETEILHTAVVEVNERGTQAAACTFKLRGGGVCETIEFVVDHPFIFCIYETKSDLILFMGRVNEL